MNRYFIFAFAICAAFNLASAQELGEVVAITNEAGAQQFPDAAYNSRDDSFLAVWEHVAEDDIVEIHGVVLNGQTGKPVGAPDVLLMGVYSIEAPEIAYNGDANEFLLIARRNNDDVVLAQRISNTGVPVGEPVEIGRSDGPTYFDPAARARVATVAYNSTDKQYFIGVCGEYWGYIVNPDLSIDFPIPRFGEGTNPAAAWSSKSNVYLMAYEDRQTRNTGNENLSAQLLSSLGEPIGDAIFLRDQDFAEESPRIAYNSVDDQFLVVWDERIGFSENLNPQTLTDTIGQLVGADGSKIWNPIPIEAGTAYTLRQDVEFSPQAGAYLVVWKGDESGDFAFADILGRIVGRDGSLQSDIFLIYDGGDNGTDEGNSEQYFDESKLPVVALNAKTGAFLVVWEEAGTNRNPADRNIMARFVKVKTTPIHSWEIY
ncbi:MAG: hypothetical protein AB1656_26810 [Candidatus Omnitrophota bacterium]